MIEWQALSEQAKRAPLTDRICNPEKPGFEESMRFISGRDVREAGPTVKDVRDKSKFASNVETPIERDHAQLHRHLALAPNHSECYASCCMRRGEVTDRTGASAAEAYEFAALLDKTRRPGECIKRLGLAAHPSLAEMINDDSELSQNLPHHLANRVICHSDLQSMFLDLPQMTLGDDAPPTWCAKAWCWPCCG